MGAPAIHAVAGTSGAPVLLIHGFGADRMSWLANQQELARAGRIFALDLPGHGETPPGPGGLDDLRLAVEQALDASGIGPVHIIAHSLGGAVAIALAAARPDLVRSLAIIAGAGLGHGLSESFLDEFPRLNTPKDAEALLQRLVSRPRLINKFMVARVLEYLRIPGVREGLVALAATLRDIDAALKPSVDAVCASPIPRLAIWGLLDRIVPLDADRLARFSADPLIIADAAHLPHVEAARVVNQRLLDWLSAQTRGRDGEAGA
jgi:pyruvate dehydrogenase E2 component (dihydrolipoamide acetyltransferase)